MHKEFEVHILNTEGIEKAKKLAMLFDNVLTQVEALAVRPETAGGILLPNHFINGREMAIVRTKLEEASFFAKKAMAILPENQKEQV